MSEPGLRFGVFPLGLAGGPDGLASGPPDDAAEIDKACATLRGDGAALLVRMYVSWDGAAGTEAALGRVARAASTWADCDLVLSYRDAAGNVDAWTQFVTSVIERHGHQLDAIQVTGEANLTTVPAAADGAFPRATDALVRGVRAAGEAKRRTAAGAAIGFAVTPELDPATSPFWTDVAALADERFAGALDYVGIDMYPDVFGPRFEVDQLDGAVDWVLRSLRQQSLPRAGIGPATPIRVSENGWPTGPDRSEARQADVLEAVLRAVHARAEDLNVTHWELFALRDADSRNDDPFHNFGVLHDDYSPKPAFERLTGLFSELG